MNIPKVSIIMPVYGVEEYIGVCVDSILTQTYDNIEVLVIDDCSQDNSISILNEHVAQSGRAFSWKIIKQQENGGLSAARNAGIREASGKYIFFLDSDDKLMPNCIKDLVTEAELSHSDVTTGNRISLDWHTGKKYRMIENDYVPARTNSLKELMKIQLHGTVWNKLIKRDFILKHNLFFKTGIVYEDDLWMYYLLSCEPSFSFVSPVTYVYHVRANSTIQTFSEQHILSKIIIAADAIKHFPSISPSAQKVAVHSAERFRQGALMEFVKHFKDYSVFSKAYKLLRYLHIPAKDFFSSPYCSIASKLRFMNNYIPPAIGCLMNFISIKYILKKSPYKLTYLITNQQMVLSKEFWKHVEHCCAYENSKQNKKAFPFFCKRY